MNFLHENGAKDISVTESLAALAKFKLILLSLEREGNMKGVCKLPRPPEDVDDLKILCYPPCVNMIRLFRIDIHRKSWY